MKDDTKNLLIIGGAAVAGIYFLSKKGTTPTTEGGGTTLLGQLPLDLSWLGNIIPQTGLPSVSLTTGETGEVTGVLGGLLDNLLSIVRDLGLNVPGVVTPTPTPEAISGQPDKTTPPPTNVIPTSRTGLTTESGLGDIGKSMLLNMYPWMANALMGAGAAGLLGAGAITAKYLGPGVKVAGIGFGERMASIFKRFPGLGKIGGGSLGIIPPGLGSPEAMELVKAGHPEALVGWGVPTGIGFLDWFQQQGGLLGLLRGGGQPAQPGLGGVYPITDRKMKSGEAPPQKGGYDTTGYSSLSYLSSRKPLGPSEPSAPPVSPQVLTAIQKAGGSPGAYTQMMMKWGGFAASGGRF